MQTYQIVDRKSQIMKVGSTSGAYYYIFILDNEDIMLIDNFSLQPVSLVPKENSRLLRKVLGCESVTSEELNTAINEIKEKNIYRGKLRDIPNLVSSKFTNYLLEERIITRNVVRM